MLAPISFASPLEFMAALSDAEQACVLANVDPDILTSFDPAQDDLLMMVGEEGAALIGCFDHETTLRLFLTTILSVTGPLAAESSNCIRNSFTDVDLAVLMMTQIGESASGGDMEALDVAAMLSVFVTLSCLSEDEFRLAGSIFEMSTEDREGLQCLLDELGGPARIASLMLPDAGMAMESFVIELFGASLKCEIQISGPG